MSGKLECKRCFTAFDITIHDPRLLDCGHSVCLTCLDEMLSGESKLTCPFCKASTPYNKDPLSYKRNVTVVEALLPANTSNSADFKPKCDKCKSPSKKFCATCQKHLCSSCLEAHDFFFPKNHHIVDIEKMVPVELPAQPKIVKKPAPEPKQPEPAKPAEVKPIRKFSVSKKAPEPTSPVSAPDEDAPKPNPWRKNSVSNSSAPAPAPAPAAPKEEEKEDFPKPSANPWKKKDAAGEITAPSGPSNAAGARRSVKLGGAPHLEKTQEETPTPTPAPAAPAPAEEKTPKLPPDWAEVKDPKSGKVYYYNKKTKKTSWTAPEPEPEATPTPEPTPAPAAAPAPAAEADPDALPPGWTEHVDPRSGKTYYYNKSTKETSWKKPTASSAAPAAPAAPAGDELPPGWAECTDPSSGKVYYYNKSTKETSWKRPHA